MALLSNKTEPIGNESLSNWKSLASGGFGHVYKARYKALGYDVAVKTLHDAVGSDMLKEKAIWQEAMHMEKASCEFVLRVYGFYKGCPPLEGKLSEQQGIVMEFMERGSLESLLKDLSGPPPWPLAFRLAHQIALGMNFLHFRNLVHQDLKPSNVLLTDDFNAKVGDLGLCRVSNSALNSNTETTKLSGGSYKYMPPEAFDASYELVRAFDIYSYGILLWSILTGEEPYPGKGQSLVELRIPKGDRPPVTKIDQTKADGLKELVGLMVQCWDGNPSKRPKFKGRHTGSLASVSECIAITEKVFLRHKKGIRDAVHEVLRRLDSPANSQQSYRSVALSCPPETTERFMSNDTVDHIRITTTTQQDPVNVPAKIMNEKDKAKFVDDHKATLIQEVSEVMAIVEELGDMVHGETYSEIDAATTSQKKTRMLYQRTFRSGGVKVKAAFYDALKKHHLQLVERLGGQS